MKKFFFAALAAATLVFGFTSCNKSEDDTPETKAATVGYTCDPLTNDTFNSLCDMNMTAIITPDDGTPATSTHKLTESLEIACIIPCPCTLAFSYTFAPKSVTIDEAQSYTLAFGPSFTVESSTNSIALRGTKREMTIKGDKLKAYLEILASEKHELTFVVNEKGGISVKE